MGNCKVCLSKHLEKVNSHIDDGMKAVDIIKLYPEFSSSNISTHKKNHMIMNVPSRLDEIFREALETGISKNVNVSDLIRIADYAEKNKGRSYDDDKSEWQNEFEDRLAALEHFLKSYHIVSDYQLGAINGFTSVEEDEMQNKRSILALIRHCMTSDLVNGRVELGGLIAAIVI